MPEELKHEPVHLFCEQVNILRGPENLFLFWMRSGGKLANYVTTADHAKQIFNLLGRTIADYEKIHGPLQGRLPGDPMLSPIQHPEPPAEPPKV